MASKQTYECYVCKRNGFADVRVYLDGKAADGKTIYKNEDMTPHQHKQQPTQSQASTTVVTQATREDRILQMLNDLNIKIDYILKCLDSGRGFVWKSQDQEEQQKPQQQQK